MPEAPAPRHGNEAFAGFEFWRKRLDSQKSLPHFDPQAEARILGYMIEALELENLQS